MDDRQLMQRAVELAEKGRMHVSPNPMVGAVIVRNGKIIAEGWHRRFGGKHAEAAALANAGAKANGATMYVSLEPCCHFGKQPPCTEKIIESGIRKVVVGVKDPNPVVDGKGLAKLRKAGIAVKMLDYDEVRLQNRKFFKFAKTRKPFVMLKVAMTADGKITWGNGRRKKISGKESLELAHRMRSEYDAILVGIGTVLKDNPRLTSRGVGGRNPLRIIVDSAAKIPLNANVLNKDSGTLIVCTGKAKSPKLRRIQEKGAGIMIVREKKGRVDLKNMLEQIGMAGISSVLVEGGAEIINAFISEGLADAFVFALSPKIVGSGIDAISAENRKILFVEKAYGLGNDLILEGAIGKKRPRRKS